MLVDKDGSSDNWLELAENFFETAYQAREVMESDDSEKKRDLVQTIGGNLLLRDKNLEFSFKKPYDVLLKPEVRSDVQSCTNKFERCFKAERRLPPTSRRIIFRGLAASFIFFLRAICLYSPLARE